MSMHEAVADLGAAEKCVERNESMIADFRIRRREEGRELIMLSGWSDWVGMGRISWHEMRCNLGNAFRFINAELV